MVSYRPIDDKEPQVPRIRSLADYSVYVLVPEAVTNGKDAALPSPISVRRPAEPRTADPPMLA